ncbi:MAG: SLBB domain-containing protein [bacterium]|nr:SLBB domain-containing protein [bacterium]
MRQCRLARCAVVLAFFAATVAATATITPAVAQTPTPEMLDEAARRTGLSKEELLRRYAASGGAQQPGAEPTAEPATEPGRTSLEGIDDTNTGGFWRDTDVQVTLPLATVEALKEGAQAAADSSLTGENATFGASFFHLDAGVFQPPSFGPVPADYRLGVGDELAIHAWGEVDFQLTRVVDRDGSVILPRSGKVVCAGRTLGEVEASIREQLARSHASIAGQGEGATQVEVTLGQLRPIRIYVIGEATRPGSYQLSSASTVLTALYAAGGPAETGSYRDIRLMRGSQVIATLDLYDYLARGVRTGDRLLQEGDTVFIPDRLRRVQVTGPVRRPMFYEMKPGESLPDLLEYAGGLTPQAVPDLVHIRRVLPARERKAGQPDHVFLDIALKDGKPAPGSPAGELMDGDHVVVDAIGERLDRYVDVRGSVKVPGRYEYRDGLTVKDLLAMAGGLWPDAMTDQAVIDRTSASGDLFSVTIPLSATLNGTAEPVALQSRDALHVFARWELQRRPQVFITGEVYDPVSPLWREGMTLRELVLKAGGLRDSANLLQAEVSRLLVDAVTSTDITRRPEQTVAVLRVPLGADFLERDDGFQLKPYDRVAIRRLPWWELQQTVVIRGEVFFPGQFSLERKDERLSALVQRAGGLRPDAYLEGARVQRAQDGVGNVAIDLAKALQEPGSEHDIILLNGDEVIIPDRMFTVKVVGEVGFPTSLVWEEGKKINWYVDRAGGFLEKADKGKSRVVWPNGMSLPNKGGSKVIAGSTIIVPRKAPPEGESTLAKLKEISGILAGLATVWLVIDRTN